jgi:peptidoglycan/xylan/chitin deacetylase (PgdA/CDA1 family)
MLTSVKSRRIPQICSWVPLNLWHRLVRVELLVPHWHVASDEELPHISGLYQYRTLGQFTADLEFFLENYRPVSLEDVIDHLDGVRALPKRCFLPTFDDGFREVHDLLAPLLHRRGVPAAFFLITSVVDNRELCYPQKKSLLLHALSSQRASTAERELSRLLTRAGIPGSNLRDRIRSIYYRQRHLLDELAPFLGCDFSGYVRSVRPYLTSPQVQDLRRMGFALGAHSVDHPLYSELTVEEQVSQTERSLSWLSERFRCACQAFAFPYQDAGISPEFFSQAFESASLKVSFGIGGVRHRFFRRNLPRFSMERTDLPAGQILARQFGRALL